MNRYRVFGGIANIGAGVLLGLTAAQIKSRVHALELPKGYDPKVKDAKSAEVKASAPLQFKVGEVISLDDVPVNLLGILEPLDPPKSPMDEKAADHALRVQDPKAHARKVQSKRAAAAAAKAKR